jgi:hypothetical protein
MTAQNRFVDPGPADIANEVLFEKRPDFLRNLQSIADHIARPAMVGEPFPSMTFALYGRWGAGKSTALKRLKQEVRNRVDEARGDFTYSDYDAPLWEQLPDVRGTLAYTIVRGMSPDSMARLIELLKRLAGDKTVDSSIRDRDWDLNQALQFWKVLEQLPIAPPLLEEWMREIAGETIGAGYKPEDGQDRPSGKVHVVFIDDVDRCSKQFTADLLAATTYWSRGEQRNLFFVLAASREHLIESLREHLPLGTKYPEQALEKYVHVSVEVPALLGSPAEVGAYISKLIDQVAVGGGIAPARLEELREMVVESAKAYPECVLAPLLQLGDGLTPRTVKHRFNAFLAEFKPAEDLVPADVKLWVLKAFWQDFWWKHLWNLPIGAEEPDTEWERRVDLVTRLRDLGYGLLPFWGLETVELRPILASLGEQSGIDLHDVDPSLAIYLAVEPVWKPPPRGVGGEIKRTDRAGRPGEPEAGEQASTPTDEDDIVLLEYLGADQARRAGNRQEARAHVMAIQQAARGGGLESRAAATVGNAALVAEWLEDDETALELHQAAVRLDPEHYNVLQNYVDFITDRHRAELYPEAERLVGILRNEGRNHKPERTLNLAMRLQVAKGVPTAALGPQIEEAVTAAVNDLTENPSVDRLAAILQLLIDTKQFQGVRNACRIVAEAVTTDRERYTVLRFLADTIAKSDKQSDEQEAADLYVFMLAKGLPCFVSEDDAVDVKHNLATLLSVLDYDNAAGLLLEEAYGRRPNDETIRRALAVALTGLDRKSEAATVLVGQRLEPLTLTAEPLPPRFAPGVDAWWERLPMEQHEPCESYLTRS